MLQRHKFGDTQPGWTSTHTSKFSFLGIFATSMDARSPKAQVWGVQVRNLLSVKKGTKSESFLNRFFKLDTFTESRCHQQLKHLSYAPKSGGHLLTFNVQASHIPCMWELFGENLKVVCKQDDSVPGGESLYPIWGPYGGLDVLVLMLVRLWQCLPWELVSPRVAQWFHFVSLMLIR